MIAAVMMVMFVYGVVMVWPLVFSFLFPAIQNLIIFKGRPYAPLFHQYRLHILDDYVMATNIKYENAI